MESILHVSGELVINEPRDVLYYLRKCASNIPDMPRPELLTAYPHNYVIASPSLDRTSHEIVILNTRFIKISEDGKDKFYLVDYSWVRVNRDELVKYLNKLLNKDSRKFAVKK